MYTIEELLERYFEGLTSGEEEAELRRFFTTGSVPEHLAIYKPLFAYFESEIEKEKATTISQQFVRADLHEVRKNYFIKYPLLIRWLSSVAACAAILIGVVFFATRQGRCPKSGDYVIINGRCYTDVQTIRSATFNALREISTEEAFSDGNSTDATDIITNQLKQFDSLFDEEE